MEKIRIPQILETKVGKEALPAQLQSISGDADNQSLIDLSLVNKAIGGDVKAAQIIQELSTNQSVPLNYYGIPSHSLGKSFVDINRQIDARTHRFYDFKGGRGSLKSSFCALKIVDLIMKEPRFCAVVLRQIKETLRDSVFAQIAWAIDELNLTKQFTCTKSPLQIVKNDTKQVIYFRGADDPSKIKSLKPQKNMYVGVIWFEECDQFRGEEAIRNILQSLMRGGDDILVFRSYNTPRSHSHFLNADTRNTKDNRLVHHSYYYDAPREWLGNAFFEQAEYLKEHNELSYRHEYLGEAIGNGSQVFENLEIRNITDEEIARFDRIYLGLDWGYFPDPAAFVQVHFSMSQRTLYIFGELHRLKSSNAQLAADLDGFKHMRITSDSSEPKSIYDFKSYGFNIRGATKGPGSVEYSTKWLAGLSKIVIDSTRCPHASNEFLMYEYAKTADGQLISGFPDCDNHFIDATRYALEDVWRRKGL